MVLLALFVLFSVTDTITQTPDFEYYVNSTGYDSDHCGNSTHPCGTLYQTSILIQQQQTSNGEFNFKIDVINGQNQNEILKYHTLNNTNKYNPCFPIPFDSTISIEISFIGNISISN
eukprot:296588_1